MRKQASSYMARFLSRFVYVAPEERIKLLLLSLAFFCVIGSYTVVRGLKDSLFVAIVGDRSAMGTAKLWSMFLLIPAVLLFSRLVDRLRRSYLLILYSTIYVVGCFVLGYYVGHPLIGLANTQQSTDRWFGWIVYFFLEGFNPFVVSLFWSFAHSVTSPEAAKGNYPIMVAASKLGGVVATTYACSLLACPVMGAVVSDVYNHQHLFYASGLLLACVPFIVLALYRLVPSGQLHGYEAAYKADRLKDKEERRLHDTSWRHKLQQSFEGLLMMVRVPYVMGIFGVVFFWELVNVFINFERVAAAKKTAISLSHQTSVLLGQDFWVHAVGLFITLLGTRALIEWLGERRALLLVPVTTGALLVYYFIADAAEAFGYKGMAVGAMGMAYILLKALNYAFAQPLRESLYIPTTRSVKFKSKSWVDSFGTKFAKAMGGTYSSFVETVASKVASQVLMYNAVFFSSVIGLWVIVAHFLGRRYERAVAKQEVIGLEEQEA